MFKTNINKDYIRKHIDEPIIKKFFEQGEITYFGLPGPEILDLLEWREYINKIISVEIDEISSHLLLENIMINNYSLENFQLLHGDIDNILLKGHDKYGTQIRFPFNLVNLDYVGGVIYKDLKGRSKRIRAIQSLFNRQKITANDFLLLFTFNIRNRDRGEFGSTIDLIEAHITDFGYEPEKSSKIFEWYRNSDIHQKLKIFVLYLIESIAHSNQFNCTFHDPITYAGSGGSRMVHFAFTFKWVSKIRPGITNCLNILNTQMKEVKDDTLTALNSPILKLGEE